MDDGSNKAGFVLILKSPTVHPEGGSKIKTSDVELTTIGASRDALPSRAKLHIILLKTRPNEFQLLIEIWNSNENHDVDRVSQNTSFFFQKLAHGHLFYRNLYDFLPQNLPSIWTIRCVFCITHQ